MSRNCVRRSRSRTRFIEGGMQLKSGEALNAISKILFPEPREQEGLPVFGDAHWNLVGARIDLERTGADPVCIGTIQRVQQQARRGKNPARSRVQVGGDARMRHKVICIQSLHPEGMKILNSREDLEIIVPDSPDPATWANFLPGTEAICVRLTKIPRSMMEAAPNLKIISRHRVGLDKIDVAAAAERGGVVATVGLANAPSVVEHTIAMMFSLAKRLPEFDRAAREGDYYRGRTTLASMDVGGRTVLIIGLGR